MKYLIVTLVLFSSAFSFSQDSFMVPDYDKIEKNIKKKNSKFYYPKLFERYLEGDSTLSKEEKHHLYYGYIFQDGYSPYGSSDYSDSINYVMNLDPDSNDVFQKMITYSDSVLAKFPFSINALKYQSIAYMNLGDKKNEDILMNKVDVIFTALFNSGDGITKESCFYVINAHHEYEMLYILGFDFGGEQKLIEHYDYLKLAKNEQGIEGFYFDITPCLNNLNEMMKE